MSPFLLPAADPNLYRYESSRPTVAIDPLGLDYLGGAGIPIPGIHNPAYPGNLPAPAFPAAGTPTTSGLNDRHLLGANICILCPRSKGDRVKNWPFSGAVAGRGKTRCPERMALD